MVTSINTNPGSSIGLQSLNKTNSGLDALRERLATGKKVNGPTPDPSTFAIAQKLLGEIGGTVAVKEGLNAAEATTGVAISAGQAVSDLLIDLKGIAIQASQDGLDATSRQALETEFNALRDQIGTVVDSAGFNGTNLIQAGGAGLDVLASENGDRFNVAAQDLSAGGLGIAGLTLGTAADAANAVAALDGAVADVSAKLADLGASAKRIETQADATTKLTDSLRQGVGNLVDADLGAEAAALASGQVKQSLGIQALNIANSAPRYLTELF